MQPVADGRACHGDNSVNPRRLPTGNLLTLTRLPQECLRTGRNTNR